MRLVNFAWGNLLNYDPLLICNLQVLGSQFFVLKLELLTNNNGNPIFVFCIIVCDSENCISSKNPWAVLFLCILPKFTFRKNPKERPEIIN